ncbi:MAG: hypothetical protein PHU85_15345, partial [Phycisphaerae bacterium]|nr:hypothetical protein [Phycisphaerae bacterium]
TWYLVPPGADTPAKMDTFKADMRELETAMEKVLAGLTALEQKVRAGEMKAGEFGPALKKITDY